jgi:hypothetical protein
MWPRCTETRSKIIRSWSWLEPMQGSSAVVGICNRWLSERMSHIPMLRVFTAVAIIANVGVGVWICSTSSVATCATCWRSGRDRPRRDGVLHIDCVKYSVAKCHYDRTQSAALTSRRASSAHP